jgi:hypothetical protein
MFEQPPTTPSTQERPKRLEARTGTGGTVQPQPGSLSNSGGGTLGEECE